jgi:hypothetical protein
LPMAGIWAHYVSGFFILAYKETAKGTALVPSGDFDFETLLQYFVVQKAMTIFNAFLKKDPKRVIIAQTMLREVLRPLAEENPAVASAVVAGAGRPVVAAPLEGAAAGTKSVAAGITVAAAGIKVAAAGVTVAAAGLTEEVSEPKPADVEAEKAVQGDPVRH